MSILVTGVAGFIGMHAAAALLARGETVIGIDNLDGYYDPVLKRARLARLNGLPGFAFLRADIADDGAMDRLALEGVDRILHLAAQAGVRYSLENPRAYVRANIAGHLNLLELARRRGVSHFVYASSSSVYGDSGSGPLAAAAAADRPRSLYAATKRADEMMTESYVHLYGFRATGLRYFTVYGPWGRPDMAPTLFARAMLAGEPIPVFNEGRLARDFTFVEDAVAGTLGALDRTGDGHRIYNIGNGRAEPLMRFIETLEATLGVKARIDLRPMQPGDVLETCADIGEAARHFDYAPRTAIDEGLPRFSSWYRSYYGPNM
ncbi:MAG: NAD-dependent epimerase/dehydratase family protein [Alphaproteobacteria bacterium]|nr:NAD-dependent epimerase/dehydratase family protein [Alphaproteobacteria bacterium]